MTRSTFLSSLAALIAAPFIKKEKPSVPPVVIAAASAGIATITTMFDNQKIHIPGTLRLKAEELRMIIKNQKRR